MKRWVNGDLIVISLFSHLYKNVFKIIISLKFVSFTQVEKQKTDCKTI